MVKLISVKRTPGERKEFGTSSNFVTNNKKTPADRLAYIARHRKNENWNNYMTPGSLSRWLLWEDRSLNTNVRNFRKRFKI